MKDMLTEGRRPEHRWAPTPGRVFRQVPLVFFQPCRLLQAFVGARRSLVPGRGGYGSTLFCGLVVAPVAVANEEYVVFFSLVTVPTATCRVAVANGGIVDETVIAHI